MIVKHARCLDPKHFGSNNAAELMKVLLKVLTFLKAMVVYNWEVSGHFGALGYSGEKFIHKSSKIFMYYQVWFYNQNAQILRNNPIALNYTHSSVLLNKMS